MVDVKDLLEQYAEGKRQFFGADLSGADLSRADLSLANLGGADLSGADLSGADLSLANLGGANLFGAYLSRAYLSRAYLSRAYLSGADLSGADLSGADLSRADLSRAYLGGADLRGANLFGADLSRAKSLVNARGVYSLFSLNLSSRGDSLYAGIDEDFKLVFYAGCFTGSAAKLRAAVAEKPDIDPSKARYQIAIDAIEALYTLDMESGIWQQMKAAAILEVEKEQS